MNYLSWNEKTISDFSDKAVSEMYAAGFVFTRLGKGIMGQTRSVRIDLSKFELSSENRRILKKTGGLELTAKDLPLADYDFKLGKLAKDFYEEKFGSGIMSAQKVKEMLTDAQKSNFNVLLAYSLSAAGRKSGDELTASSEADLSGSSACGYAISYRNSSLLHYSYPFYDLGTAPKDMGLGMMIRAIQHAKESGLAYIYLGSLQRPGDSYKLQFSGLEWFDGSMWKTDIEEAKAVLK